MRDWGERCHMIESTSCVLLSDSDSDILTLNEDSIGRNQKPIKFEIYVFKVGIVCLMVDHLKEPLTSTDEPA